MLLFRHLKKNVCLKYFISGSVANPPYVCSENFVLISNYCLPSCPNWVLRNKGENADDIILIITAVVGLICGILVLVISIVRRRRM